MIAATRPFHYLHRIMCIGLMLFTIHNAQNAFAQKQLDNNETPLLLNADSIEHDDKFDIIIARGNVVVETNGEIIKADLISYNQAQDMVTANGNIVFSQADGTVIYSDYIELTGDFKNGFIKTVQARLSDNSRLVASEARMSKEGTRVDYNKVAYTRCEACKDDPQGDLLWQMEADQITHYKERKRIEYHDVALKFSGVPVLYTPYFYHPDPTVKRSSGFLAPRFGFSSAVGNFFGSPYFWALDESKDATLELIGTTKELPVLVSQYRQSVNRGNIEIDSSITNSDRRTGPVGAVRTKKDKTRGHFFVDGTYNISPTWQSNLDFNRVSDSAYMSQYSFLGSSNDELRSSYKVEGFRGRNYAQMGVSHYQDLRAIKIEETPKILPELSFSGLGDTDQWNGRWKLDAVARNFSQKKAVKVHAISVDSGYETGIVGPAGTHLNLDGIVRSSYFIVDAKNKVDSYSRYRESKNIARITPIIGADLTWPLARYIDNGRQMITPRLAYVAATRGGNSAAIPATDSSATFFDINNMFQTIRMAGVDRIETGQRAVYGTSASHYWAQDFYARFFLGQSVQLSQDNTLTKEFGLREGGSDILGAFEIDPSENFYLRQNASIARKTGALSKLNTTLKLDFEKTAFQLDHVVYKDNTLSDHINELQLNIDQDVSAHWSSEFSISRDMHHTTANRTISYAFGMSYDDECFAFNGTLSKNLVSRVGSNSGIELMFNIDFKTISSLASN